jgi:hypothetical protein
MGLRKYLAPLMFAGGVLMGSGLTYLVMHAPDADTAPSGDAFYQKPVQLNAFERLKFEVDYIKHLTTMCAAAIAFIAGYLKAQDDKPPAWMTSGALAAFILAACICTGGYALKNAWVIEQYKPVWQVWMDRAFGAVTDLVFLYGIAMLLIMCFRPLWAAAPNRTLQQTGHETNASPSSVVPPA